MLNYKIVEDIINDLNAKDQINPALFGNFGLGHLLLLCYDQTISNKDHSKKIKILFDNLQLSLLNSPLGYTFHSGLSGLGWTINHLQKKQMIELENESLLDQISQMVGPLALKDIDKNNHDFLHGGLGAALYLIEQTNICKSNKELINDILKVLKKKSKKNKRGTFWLTTPYLMEHVNKSIINLGLAHGLASKIQFLSKSLTLFPSRTETKDLLRSSVDYLLSCKVTNRIGNSFPYMLIDGIPSKSSRLAWCHGDLGISVSIWNAGVALDDVNLKSEAIQICQKTIDCYNHKKNDVDETCICHGSIGLALIYNRMFINTGITNFRDESKKWLDWTITRKSNGGIGGFKFKDQMKKNDWINDTSLLNGASGVALGLLSCESNNNYDWDKCLLM